MDSLFLFQQLIFSSDITDDQFRDEMIEDFREDTDFEKSRIRDVSYENKHHS